MSSKILTEEFMEQLAQRLMNQNSLQRQVETKEAESKRAESNFNNQLEACLSEAKNIVDKSASLEKLIEFWQKGWNDAFTVEKLTDIWNLLHEWYDYEKNPSRFSSEEVINFKKKFMQLELFERYYR